MKLHELKAPEGARKERQRVARGRAGRRGKTAGRGTKGAKARGQIAVGYEGGQMPLHMRLPKLPGFRNFNRVEFTVVNLSKLADFDANTTVDASLLRSKGLVRKKGQIKVLGHGDLTKPLTVRVHACSATASEKITAAGGKVEIVESAVRKLESKKKKLEGQNKKLESTKKKDK